MKKSFLAMGLLVVGGFLLFAGCVERTVYVQRPPVAGGPPGEVVVTEAPPPIQTEVIVEAPGPGYIWVPGYWAWQGRWVWVRGSWVLPPHPRALWIRGHWVHRGHGYVWIGGHWR